MIDQDQAARFRRMQESGPRLLEAFNALTQAHGYFQGPGQLKTVSVSDVLDNGCIEATFQGVRIKFAAVPVFSASRTPRGRVIVMNCHCTYGAPVQDLLGSFSYDEDGTTDLDPDHDGNFPRLSSEAPEIILRYLDAAFLANKAL